MGFVENHLNKLQEAKAIVPYVNLCTHFITTDDAESTEKICPYFLYSVFSVLSVVNLPLEVGEETLALDYK
jgi:hypothetical protein